MKKEKVTVFLLLPALQPPPSFCSHALPGEPFLQELPCYSLPCEFLGWLLPSEPPKRLLLWKPPSFPRFPEIFWWPLLPEDILGCILTRKFSALHSFRGFLLELPPFHWEVFRSSPSLDHTLQYATQSREGGWG